MWVFCVSLCFRCSSKAVILLLCVHCLLLLTMCVGFLREFLPLRCTSKAVILLLFIHCLLLLTMCVGFLREFLFCDVVLRR